MTDLDDLAKSSMQGGFYLFIGRTLSIVILAVNSIIIARLLGPDEYGLYTITFIVPSLLMTLCDVGISPTLFRYTTTFLSEGRYKSTSSLIKIGLSIKTILVLLVSIFYVLLSDYIAINVFFRPELSNLLRLSSLNIVGQALLGTVINVFLGLDKPINSIIFLNVQAILTLLSSVILIMMGRGLTGAIFGTSIGSFSTALIGLIFIVSKITPRIDVIGDLHENIKVLAILKIIVQYGAPIYLSAIIHTLRGQFQKILLTMYALNTEIGNYQTAMNFTFVLTSILVTLYNSLLPSFSKINVKIDRESLVKIYKLSVKYSSLIIIPMSIAFIAFSQPLIILLYGDQYNTAALYLSLYALNFLYVGFGRYNYGVLLHSQAQTKISLKINIISFIISIPFILYLIPNYGVLGFIISMYIYNFINTISGLYVIKKEYNIFVNIMSFLKILISSFISYLIVVTLHSYLKNEILKIVLGGLVYVFSLMVFSPLVGVINESDLHTIGRSSSGVPILNFIFKPILKIEMLLIRFMKSFS